MNRVIVLITFLIKKQKIIGVKVGVSLFIDPYFRVGSRSTPTQDFSQSKASEAPDSQIKASSSNPFPIYQRLCRRNISDPNHNCK